MATTETTLVHGRATAALAPRLTAVKAVVKFIRTKPLGAAGAAIILGMMVVAASSGTLAPYDPYQADYAAQFARPNLDHWFGTDEFGRDLMSRIMYGARIALFVGFTASFVGCTLGGLLGVTSAYCGGKIDLFLERLMDILLAFPQLILALAIASILGPAVQNVVIAISIPIVPRAARIVRAAALSVKEHIYVEAVQALAPPSTASSSGTSSPTWWRPTSSSSPRNSAPPSSPRPRSASSASAFRRQRRAGATSSRRPTLSASSRTSGGCGSRLASP